MTASGTATTEFADAASPRSRNVWIIGAAALMTMLPVTLLVPVLREILADRFAASTFWTHSFMSINMIGAIAALPLIARFSDRAGSRRMVIATALLLDAVLFLGMSRAASLPVVLALRALEGATHMLAISSLMAMAADGSAPNRRGRMMGLIGSCMMFGTAAGTRLGGVVWRTWPGWTFEAAAMIAMFTAVFVAVVLPSTSNRATPRKRLNVVALLRNHRELFVPYAYTFIDRLCVGFVISTFVLFLAECHGLDPDGRSRLLALFLVPFALLVYPAGRLTDRIGGLVPLAFGSIAFGLLFACYGIIPARWLPVAMVASGVLSALMFAPTLALTAELAPPGRRGAAFAGFNAAGSLGFVCGPILGGAVCQLLSGRLGTAGAFQSAFVVAGATEVACAVLTLRLLLKLQRGGSLWSTRRIVVKARSAPRAGTPSVIAPEGIGHAPPISSTMSKPRDGGSR